MIQIMNSLSSLTSKEIHSLQDFDFTNDSEIGEGFL